MAKTGHGRIDLHGLEQRRSGQQKCAVSRNSGYFRLLSAIPKYQTRCAVYAIVEKLMVMAAALGWCARLPRDGSS